MDGQKHSPRNHMGSPRMERGSETKNFEFGDWVPAVILFLFLRAIVPDLASLKISARFFSLNKPIGAAPWGQFFGGRGEWAFWYGC